MSDLTPADIDRLLELDRCPRCNCHSYARVDERQPVGGFGPGPEVRCVNCKHVWRNLARPLAEQARRVPALEAEIDRLRDQIYDSVPKWQANDEYYRAEKAEAALAAARGEIERLRAPMGFAAALCLASEGYEAWATKPHNARWVRKIDGTPIPNDLLVCIAEQFALSALAKEPQA